MTKDWLHGLFLRGGDEELDSDLASLFSQAPGVPGPDLGSVARTRARVPAELRQSVSASWGMRRKLALGTLGGGGIWATLIGTAAAHKAVAAAVGLGVLLSGGAALEVSGIGEAVREAVGIQQSAKDNANPHAAAGADNAADSADDSAAVSATEGSAEGAADGAQLGAASVETGDAPEGTPGQLVTQLHGDGAFTVRALLVDVDEDSILVEVGNGVQHDLTLGEDVSIQLPGQRDGEGDVPTLEDLQALVGEGHLVFVRGACDAEADDLDDESCTVTSIVVIGNAGVGGAGVPEDAGMPEDPGSQAGDHAPLLPTAQPNSADGAENAGQPDEPGRPDDTPPVSLPSTPGN